MTTSSITTYAPNQVTTLDAKGLINPSPADYLEYGSSATLTSLYEYVPELRPGLPALRTYDMMMRNDAQVAATMRAAYIPILSADWFVEPYSDTPLDKNAADYVNWNLFQPGVMATSFAELLEQIVTCLGFGASVFEKVWDEAVWVGDAKGANARRVTMLRKLAFRPMNTIIGFEYDQTGGPNGVIQMVFDPSNPTKDPNEIFIPIEKLAVFVWNKQAMDMRGQSILRSAYKHWWYKEQFYKIDGIQKERHGIGVPRIKLPPAYNDKDLAFARELGRNIRANARAYILQPPGWEIDFVKPEGNLVDALTSAEHHDLMIARNILVAFMNMVGGSGSGGRAAGAVLLDLFLNALRFFAKLIQGVFNNYIIPQLVRYNFPAGRLPTLQVRQLGEEKDLQAFAAAIRNLRDAAVLRMDAETEDWIRDKFDMPDFQGPEIDSLTKQVPPIVPGADTAGKGAPVSGGNTPAGAAVT